MKKLLLDIETRPNLAWVWGLWNQNIAINQIQESGSVFLVGAKWYGAPKRDTFLFTGPDMIGQTWELVNEADAVIHYNGTSFDMKHLNAMFVQHGLTPPSPYVNIDLLRVVRQNFRFPSNKLDYVADVLLGKRKVKHDGFQLWVDCIANDPKAWEKMKKYCAGDVNLLEPLYDKLLPWIPNHPVVGLYDGSGGSVIQCPNCGNRKMESRGMAYTRLGSYRRYVCKGCGKWAKGGSRVGGTITR